MSLKKFASIAALSLTAIASFSYADSAQAMSFTMSAGTTGPQKETNQGAYTTDPNAFTVDFNDTKNAQGKKVDGKAPTTGFAQYSFANGGSPVSNSWAPTGSKGEKNDSKYLEIFQGNAVTITLESLTKSFGLDWGAAHPGNTLSFFNGDKLIQSFNTADIGQFALYSAFHQGPKAIGAIASPDGKSYYQGNGYVQFLAQNSDEYFNKIVISHIGTGGFESDNHSFRTVPEPSLVLGMLAIGGGMFLRKRKNQKTVNLA